MAKAWGHVQKGVSFPLSDPIIQTSKLCFTLQNSTVKNGVRIGSLHERCHSEIADASTTCGTVKTGIEDGLNNLMYIL
jgi:hypothetical protein